MEKQTFGRFISDLRGKACLPLPGEPAQLEMAPPSRTGKLKGIDLNAARKAAVLVLFYPARGISTVLIQRQDYGGIHSNQISFPGGQFEPADQTLVQTALRETSEEIGIEVARIEVIGRLTELYIPPSNFLVLPVLGYMEQVPVFKPDEQEVKKVISVPLDILRDKGIKQERFIRTSYQQKLSVPCYMVDGNMVWGATAMIISELLALIDA